MASLPFKSGACGAPVFPSPPRRYKNTPISPMIKNNQLNNKLALARKQVARLPPRILPPRPLLRVHHTYPGSSSNVSQSSGHTADPAAQHPTLLDAKSDSPTKKITEAEDRCPLTSENTSKMAYLGSPIQITAPKIKSDELSTFSGLHYEAPIPAKTTVPATSSMAGTKSSVQPLPPSVSTPRSPPAGPENSSSPLQTTRLPRPPSIPSPSPIQYMPSHYFTKFPSNASVLTESPKQLSATWGSDPKVLDDPFLLAPQPPGPCSSSNDSTNRTMAPNNAVVLRPLKLTARPGVEASGRLRKSSRLGQTVTGPNGKTLRITRESVGPTKPSRASRPKSLYMDFYSSCGCTDGGREECVSCRILKKADEFCMKVDSKCTEMRMPR